MNTSASRHSLPLLIAVAAIASLTAVADVAIKPYFVREAGVVSLVVRVTNTGVSTLNVATEGYTLEVKEEPGLELLLNYKMPSFDHEDENWLYVPSKQRLGIVELRGREHALVYVPLNRGLARKLLDADASYAITYGVDGAFASRFGIWSGKAEIKQQSSPYKEGSEVVMLQDDGVNPDNQSLSMLPAVSVGGLRIGGEGALIDPTTIPKVGDKITIRPAPGSSLRRRVTGEFGGFAASQVIIGNRRYYILDIHPQDRQQFYDWSTYHNK